MLLFCAPNASDVARRAFVTARGLVTKSDTVTFALTPCTEQQVPIHKPLSQVDQKGGASRTTSAPAQFHLFAGFQTLHQRYDLVFGYRFHVVSPHGACRNSKVLLKYDGIVFKKRHKCGRRRAVIFWQKNRRHCRRMFRVTSQQLTELLRKAVTKPQLYVHVILIMQLAGMRFGFIKNSARGRRA